MKAFDRSLSGLCLIYQKLIQFILMTTKAEHQHKIVQLLKEFDTVKNSSRKIATNKKSTNLFRVRQQKHVSRLGMRGFNDVIAIDTKGKTATVEGMCSYQRLVEQTLARGLMPAVVPQLKTITLGGAISGIGIESSSFKYGLTHETVLEMQILTGTGEIVTARPDNDHKDLYHGFPNSYGTLGYSLSIKISLVAVKPFVRITHLKFKNPSEYFKTLKNICDSQSWKGEKIDFIDGVIFADHSMYLVLGLMVSSAPYTSDYTNQNIFYKSLLTHSEDYLTINDYIWRWDTDWFWCSKNVGAQNPIMRRIIGHKRLNSAFYMKLFGLEAKYKPMALINTALNRPRQETIIQDVELPIQSSEKFLKFFNESIGIKPIWICPVRQTDSKKDWTLYRLKPGQLYVNFGFWDSAPSKAGWTEGYLNRKIEQVVAQLKGKKSLYSDSFYTKEEFGKQYNQKGYDMLKSKYDPAKRYNGLYQKTVKKG